HRRRSRQSRYIVGSLADIAGPPSDVRFTPESGHSWASSAYHRGHRPAEDSSQSHRAFDQARLDNRQFAYSRACTMIRVCKTDQIRAAWAAGDQIGALRIAARFFDRSAVTKTFQRGMNAYNHPGFYRQLGKEPQELVQTALEILAKQFDL